MKTVGIRILKNNLSHYMKYVKMGETILITERNHVIAEIKSPESSLDLASSRTERFLEEEERKGTLIRASKKYTNIDKLLKKKKIFKNVKLDWKEIYKDSRADRF